MIPLNLEPFIFDCEVFAYDWLFVFKNKVTGEYTIIHNDNDAIWQFLREQPLLCGFNNKAYDNFILKAVAADCTPQEVKALSDYLIDGGQGWQHPLMRNNPVFVTSFDIRDDMYEGLSLKACEGHLGMSVVESSVPFDLDRPLTDEELDETIFYCKHDVDATEKLVDLRQSYLQTKINLGRRVGISDEKALSCTNAKLTALMLNARRREWNDGRDYVYPSRLDVSIIPQEILDFFDTIHDKSIPDEVLFKTALTYKFGDFPCRYAWGGVHGSVKGYHGKSTAKRVIQNRDVSSLYPSLLELFQYLSRNVPDPHVFYNIRKERIQAKHDGNDQLAKDLKLPLNTVSGAQENRYNDLYDPLKTRSMRISGQLFLTMLLVQLLQACKSIVLLNFNTDGLMYEIDADEVPIVDSVCTAWEQTTGFELELDEIDEVWIKDVNNLILRKTNGKVKSVGSYVSYGATSKGAWQINNSMVIVKKALIDYFTKGVPVRETIMDSTDIMDFQIIAKAGSSYDGVVQKIGNREVQVQRVNRVYAIDPFKDCQWFGTLYALKGESYKKIGNIPDHCLVDNDNHLSLNEIDREWYIATTEKRIMDFLGEKRRRNTRRVNSIKKKLLEMLEV